MLLPATPGWVSLPVVVGVPRHSWLRVPGAVPRHSWPGSTGGGGVRLSATPGWGQPVVAVCFAGGGVPCCVCLSLGTVLLGLVVCAFVSCGFCRFRSVLCAVCCAVLCVPGCGAALRCCALCRPVLCCCVLCCFAALGWCRCSSCRAVPSGAPRRPGALCFAALCFAVFPPAVCVLSLRDGVCCCSPLYFVLCLSLGAVLCVPCPLRSVRCCASLCWCACVVLFVWCVLLLAPGAVVRCRVLCCFLWCAVVRCWVPWPVVVCWCRAVTPCCPFCFAGGVGLCLFPVCGAVVRCASCCSVPVASALLLVPRAVACPCVLWCLPGRSAVWWCRSGVSWCLAVLCVVLWCPAPCGLPCGAVLPCSVVLVGCAVRLSALVVFVFPFVLFSFAKYPCCFSVPLKTF